MALATLETEAWRSGYFKISATGTALAWTSELIEEWERKGTLSWLKKEGRKGERGSLGSRERERES